jgi:hypothetical protein
MTSDPSKMSAENAASLATFRRMGSTQNFSEGHCDKCHKRTLWFQKNDGTWECTFRSKGHRDYEEAEAKRELRNWRRRNRIKKSTPIERFLKSNEKNWR